MNDMLIELKREIQSLTRQLKKCTNENKVLNKLISYRDKQLNNKDLKDKYIIDNTDNDDKL